MQETNTEGVATQVVGIMPAGSWGRRWTRPSLGSTLALTFKSLAGWSSEPAVRGNSRSHRPYANALATVFSLWPLAIGLGVTIEPAPVFFSGRSGA